MPDFLRKSFTTTNRLENFWCTFSPLHNKILKCLAVISAIWQESAHGPGTRLALAPHHSAAFSTPTYLKKNLALP